MLCHNVWMKDHGVTKQIEKGQRIPWKPQHQNGGLLLCYNARTKDFMLTKGMDKGQRITKVPQCRNRTSGVSQCQDNGFVK